MLFFISIFFKVSTRICNSSVDLAGWKEETTTTDRLLRFYFFFFNGVTLVDPFRMSWQLSERSGIARTANRGWDWLLRPEGARN